MTSDGDADRQLMVKLPLLKIIWGTFAFPRMYAGAFVGQLGVPLVVIIGCALAWALQRPTLPASLQWIAAGVGCVLFSWLAIRCHRLVLLGSDESMLLPSRALLRIIVPFVATMVALWLAQMVLTLLLVALVVNLLPIMPLAPPGTAPGTPLPADPAVQSTLNWIAFAMSFPAFYLTARLCLLFPALAVGEQWDLRLAWWRSRGNGWRLVFIAIALPKLFLYCVNLLHRDAATPYEFGLLVAILALLLALEVIAVSLSFRELASAPERPPTRPPA